MGWWNRVLSIGAGALAAFATHDRFDAEAGLAFQFGTALILASLMAWRRAAVTTERVSLHSRLKRRFAELELFLDTRDPSLESLREAKKKRAAIEAQDPETLRRVLSRICYNEQLMSWGASEDQYRPVARLQALVAPWFNTRLRAN